MSIAYTKRETNSRMIGQALSCGAMGLCLALSVGYVAYDLFGRTHVGATGSLARGACGQGTSRRQRPANRPP